MSIWYDLQGMPDSSHEQLTREASVNVPGAVLLASPENHPKTVQRFDSTAVHVQTENAHTTHLPESGAFGIAKYRRHDCFYTQREMPT